MVNDTGDYELVGSVTGPDGTGNAKKPFTSKSGQIVVEPEFWRQPESNRTGDKFTFTVTRTAVGRAAFRGELEAAGRASGERVWCFPMDPDFDDELDSPVADVMQCALDNKGDHILAARFLSRFVPGSVAWAHVDLSASERKGGLAHVPSEFTGFGVRFATQLIGDGAVIDRLEPGP
jgi:hypothetical protein